MTKNMKRILLLLALFAVLTPSMQARTFRIMTFNIRLATSSDGINAWDYRKADVVQYLNAMKPDVFGMQEVKSGQLKYLADTLHHNPNIIFYLALPIPVPYPHRAEALSKV